MGAMRLAVLPVIAACATFVCCVPAPCAIILHLDNPGQSGRPNDVLSSADGLEDHLARILAALERIRRGDRHGFSPLPDPPQIFATEPSPGYGVRWRHHGVSRHREIREPDAHSC